MNTYTDIYAKLTSIDEVEAIILKVTGTITAEQRKHLDEQRIEAKRAIRQSLRDLPGDPLAKSLLDGSKRSCSNDWYSYYEFWYETDDPSMTDEEVAEYVNSEYSYSCQYPGGPFTRAYWARTPYGLRVITYNSLDI